MLDVETLGTAPGSVIFSLGAVRFTVDRIEKVIAIPIKLDSCVRDGLKVDPATVLWWLVQAPEPRTLAVEAMKNGQDLYDALLTFSSFLAEEEFTGIWGNGAGFDLPMLSAAYRAAGLPQPWSHRQERCYRTLRALAPHVEPATSLIAHDAIQDATAQALTLQRILLATGLPLA